MPAFAEMLERRQLLSTAAINPNEAIPFTQDVIAANPGNNPVVKLLVDIDNNGTEDAVIGEETTEGGGGLSIYQYPTTGNPNDPWTQYVIDPNADVYEAMRAADVSGNTDRSGNPVNDLIVNERGTIYWYENPLGLGENPYTSPWQEFEIGTAPQGATHEMYLSTQLAGNGELAVVDNTAIFIEQSPTNWIQVSPAAYNRTEKGLYLFNGGGLGDIDLLGTGNGPDYQVGWYENPLDYGGNPVTDTWIFHPIGPAYGNYEGGDGVSYAATDITGDGLEDVITCDGENGEDPPYLTGGLVWWQRPANILTGTWIPHTIDASITDVHNMVLADLQNNGQTEILAFEQDQSPQGRLMILFNEGGTGQNWLEQTLASDADPGEAAGDGGHNESVGDATGNGYLDILTSPHGFYTLVNPISLYLNDLPVADLQQPSVTGDPVSQTVETGSPVTFSVNADGSGPLTYQWEEDGLDIPSATGPDYTFTAAPAQDGQSFRCIVGNPAGMVASPAAVLTTMTTTLDLVLPPQSSPATIQGTRGHLIASAASPNGQGSVTYAWSVLHVPPGAKVPTLSRNNSNAASSTQITYFKDGTYIFRCTMTDGTDTPIVSDFLVDVVQTPSVMRVSPHGKVVKPGQSIRFTTEIVDQFGRAMRDEDSLRYSIAKGPGIINASDGLYTATQTAGVAIIEVELDDADDGSISAQIAIRTA
jgi:hypothetical protein